jgi:hypothetical protein
MNAAAFSPNTFRPQFILNLKPSPIMKSTLLLLSSFLLLFGCATQPPPAMPPATVDPITSLSPEDMAKIKERIAGYQTRLQLSVAQADRIRPLLKSELAQFSYLYRRVEISTSHEERVALLHEARQIQDETDADVLPMLNDTQKQEWQKIRNERREEIRAEFQHRNAGAGEVP